jgi:hypothetical protein
VAGVFDWNQKSYVPPGDCRRTVKCRAVAVASFIVEPNSGFISSFRLYALRPAAKARVGDGRVNSMLPTLVTPM